ncbi:hypothetical protein SAMN04488082_1372 [Desulfomicrobium apsheronum]|uniref:Homeodomain-like domain-containing protein n=1 Tax=Desulfomicrobium apsheronum TaxID=52560 RepID=A0A1I4AF75_9BACT|nr:hypothetical protein [Desulfomicrobium apsheronum]SFK54840.1 hypothetical protein SAMN04488082_1372 [Desulfomicrobium apsheronum]
MAVTISRVDLEALIGPECAAWLLARFGGLSLYIPKRKGAGQAIEAVVGAVAFEVLQAEFGGMNVSLPGKDKAPTLKAQIIPLIEAGLSHNEIAERLECSWRHVAGVKQDMGLTKPTARKKRQKPR